MRCCITDDVVVSEHALERTDGGEKSKCQIPPSILKRYVAQGKGRQYLDEKTGTLHFIVRKTVIAADFDTEDEVWEIVTAYRMGKAVQKRPHRYVEMTPETFKARKKKGYETEETV